MYLYIQYRSHGTYTRVKKFTRVISTRHASGVTIFLEFEYSSARVQELECSSGLRVRGLESSSARTFARALAHKTARAVGTIDHACIYLVRNSEDANLCPWIGHANPQLLLSQGRRLPPCHA
jgi:hypothetical protein